MFSPVIYNTFAYRPEWQDGMFPPWRGLQDWLHTDVPLIEHSAWLPYCVYVRFIKRSIVIPNSHGYNQQMEDEIVYWCNILLLVNKCEQLWRLIRIETNNLIIMPRAFPTYSFSNLLARGKRDSFTSCPMIRQHNVYDGLPRQHVLLKSVLDSFFHFRYINANARLHTNMCMFRSVTSCLVGCSEATKLHVSHHSERGPRARNIVNAYPANVDNMAYSYQCKQMADGI
jgi:hypothetical protein